MAALSCRETHPRWTQFTMSCLVWELNLKLGLLFASSPAWSSQHCLRIDFRDLLMHTSKGCPLDVYPTGTFRAPLWPINYATATSSVKWALSACITIKDLWKPISFVLLCTYLSHFWWHIIIKRSSIQACTWVAIQRLSGTVRSLIVRSVLPGKMIIGG